VRIAAKPRDRTLADTPLWQNARCLDSAFFLESGLFFQGRVCPLSICYERRMYEIDPLGCNGCFIGSRFVGRSPRNPQLAQQRDGLGLERRIGSMLA